MRVPGMPPSSPQSAASKKSMCRLDMTKAAGAAGKAAAPTAGTRLPGAYFLGKEEEGEKEK